jgi:hypothetical protein
MELLVWLATKVNLVQPALLVAQELQELAELQVQVGRWDSLELVASEECLAAKESRD